MTETTRKEVLDELLEVIIAYADQRMITGVDMINEALNDFDTRTALYAEVIGKSWRSSEDDTFIRLLHTLIKHASTPEEDNFNE